MHNCCLFSSQVESNKSYSKDELIQKKLDLLAAIVDKLAILAFVCFIASIGMLVCTTMGLVPPVTILATFSAAALFYFVARIIDCYHQSIISKNDKG